MNERNNRKMRTGVIVGDKADKTVVVSVKRQYIHKKFKKIVRSSKKYPAHDEKNDCHVGDTVRIMETRPLSKTKKWRVVEVLERAR